MLHCGYTGDVHAKPLLGMVGDQFKIQGVMVVEVVQAHTILAPSYRFYPDSTTESGQIESAMKAYGVRPVKLVLTATAVFR